MRILNELALPSRLEIRYRCSFKNFTNLLYIFYAMKLSTKSIKPYNRTMSFIETENNNQNARRDYQCKRKIMEKTQISSSTQNEI
jgi:hypothetical protein